MRIEMQYSNTNRSDFNCIPSPAVIVAAGGADGWL